MPRDRSHTKTIEVSIRYWTDGPPPRDKFLPKHAWESGYVRVVTNEFHGIRPQKVVNFEGPYQMMFALGKALRAAGIRLRPNTTTGIHDVEVYKPKGRSKA